MLVMTPKATSQSLDFAKVKAFEHQLDDVMEMIDTEFLKTKLTEVAQEFQQASTEINKLRLGIIYHETALNLGFIAKSNYKGYAKKSFDILNEMHHNPQTTKELLPFISSYQASALSLHGGETMKLSFIGNAFDLFEASIAKYGDVSVAPEFLRGSVSENLPWFFFSKRKFAKIDMQSIIDKQHINNEYANWRVMSFVYWAWANKRQSKKYRAQSLEYLDMAIELDVNYQAGRKSAEVLKAKLQK